ncbi:MAG: gamma-glutamyltransferase [Hyphomicrobiaceae bacterium]
MPLVASALSPNVSRRIESRKPAVKSKGGIVVSQCRFASEVGARVLKEGGHAVDAAVATAFAVGVAEPWMSGIGGVGAALVLDARSGKVSAFDFGGRSPLALDPADFPLAGDPDADLFGWPGVKENRNTVGAKAVVVPSEPAGLSLMHRSFGRLDWRRLVSPAIALAEEGPVVDWHTMMIIAGAFADLARDAGCRDRFLPGGAPPVPPAAVEPRPVRRLPAPALARTLRTLAEDGAAALYRGPLAAAIAREVQALGGYLSEHDLASYEARAVTPLEIAYRDRTIHVLPELNGGPTLAHAYRVLAGCRRDIHDAPDGAAFLAYADALKSAWEARFRTMGDAGERTAPTSTTHLSVIDRDGNIVTLTQTLLSLFGARCLLPETGILMNNGINWFDPRPGGPNAIAPGRRVLSNYVPAIMTGGGRAIGIGGCGGRKIIPAVFQLLAMNAEYGFDLDRAFHTPRIDVSGTPRVAADHRLSDEVIDTLAARHDVVLAEPICYPNAFTIASAVAREGGMNEGATEPAQPWSEAVAEDEV